jgi:hypothetical protein
VDTLVRVGMIESNPFDKVVKIKTKKESRYVTDYELNLAVEPQDGLPMRSSFGRGSRPHA